MSSRLSNVVKIFNLSQNVNFPSENPCHFEDIRKHILGFTMAIHEKTVLEAWTIKEYIWPKNNAKQVFTYSWTQENQYDYKTQESMSIISQFFFVFAVKIYIFYKRDRKVIGLSVLGT